MISRSLPEPQHRQPTIIPLRSAIDDYSFVAALGLLIYSVSVPSLNRDCFRVFCDKLASLTGASIHQTVIMSQNLSQSIGIEVDLLLSMIHWKLHEILGIIARLIADRLISHSMVYHRPVYVVDTTKCS